MENKSVFYGLLAGGFTVAIYLVSYFLQPEAMLGQVLNWGTLFLYLYFMYRAVRDARRAKGGYISFADAVMESFLTYVIGTVIWYIFYYVMFNVVDPELKELSMELAMESIENFEFLSEEMKEEALETMEEQDFMSLGQAVLGMGASIFGGLILSLVMGLIMRKEKPVDV